MSQEQLTTIIFRARPIILEMIEKLKEKRGYGTSAECLRAAIVEHYETYFKEYGRDNLGSLNPNSIKLPKLTKAQKEEKQQHEICMILDGTVETNEAGFKSCTYDIHEKVNPKLVNHFKQTLPFGMLTKDTIARQYSPSKEEVLETMESLENNK
jgi:hypothetical protein